MKEDNMALNPGETLNNRYQIAETIHEGDYAVNYKAKDTLSGNTVFIKEFLMSAYEPAGKSKKDTLYGFSGLNAARAAQIIQAECRVRLTYHHETLPRALDFFGVEDKVYFVTEWIEGKDLPALIKANHKKPLPPRTVLGWMLPILDGLEYLHQYHFYHRDVKPENILIDSSGRAFLVDEGSARIVKPLSRKNSAILYCAPEFLLQAGRAAAASDIYSAGACLYYALLAEPPLNPLDRSEEKPLFAGIENVASSKGIGSNDFQGNGIQSRGSLPECPGI